MDTTPAAKLGVIGVVGLIMVGTAVPLPAQQLAVLQARSLNEVFDGVEAVAQAAGQPIDRQTMMGAAAEMLGVEPGEFLDLDRPVAAVLPVQGMMLQQSGLVAAVPVSDAAAAIEALAALFDSHTVDGQVHVFARGQQPILYLTEANGYLRLGGVRDLVTGFDPLSASKPTKDLALELFLEPVYPMITAGLEAAKEQMKAELQMGTASGEAAPYQSEAIGPMLDLYAGGFQSLLANTSSIRLTLDVQDGYLWFADSLVAKAGSPLAEFFAAQKKGIPDSAMLADPAAGMYLAGTLALDDRQRDWLKDLADRYMSVASDLLEVESQGHAPADGSVADRGTGDPAAAKLWQEYMSAMGEFTDRWVDCLRGDAVMSFDLPEGGPFSFIEVFGMREGAGCETLISDMRKRVGDVIETSEELGSAMSIDDGPRVGGSPSLLMTFDLPKMMEQSGQPLDPEAGAAMKALYGERMTAAVAALGGYALVTGGDDATARLQGAAAKLDDPPAAPSFAPLRDGPGFSMILNLGRILAGMRSLAPGAEADLDGPVKALRGPAGRLPMTLRFSDDSATFELAASMKTIEAISAIIDEGRARAAAIDIEEEIEGSEDD